MNRKSGVKLLIIALVTGVICIALVMVNSTISERQNFRDDAVKSIESSYAGPQTLVGPVLVRPYTQTTSSTEDDGKGHPRTVQHVSNLMATSFPRLLDVHAKITPDQRHHGLYTVNVYQVASHLKGSFDVVQPELTGKVEWGEPYLALSVEDVRGIIGTPTVSINGSLESIIRGGQSSLGWKPNLSAPLRGIKDLHGHLDFVIDMQFAGTERLSIAPAGDSNHVDFTSPWPSPLFAGRFLPQTHTITQQGFTASWDISSLATGTQAEMTANPANIIDLMNVTLVSPIDPYKLSDRATKYGILFVVLTFGGFFLFEMLRHLPIHPVQYLLVGFCLAIFFLLLVSFSEHIPFAAAYVIAAAACIGILTFYLSFVLHSVARGVGFGTMLAALYATVYGLLISEDNALILGSLMLFAILAAVMVITRKVDWYKTGASAEVMPPPLPL